MTRLPGQSMTPLGGLLLFLSPKIIHLISYRVEDEDQGYRLHISGYSGTAGNSLTYHNGKKFSTRDRDNDESWSTRNCAQKDKGGWWFIM